MRFLIILHTLCIATVVLARSKSKGSSKPVDVDLLTCSDMYAEISCPHGYYISIKSAMYGRLNQSICPFGNIDKTDCSLAEALNISKAVCNNKRSCSLHVWTDQYPDPCVGTVKYLQITYQCVLCHECCENEIFKVDRSNCEESCVDYMTPETCTEAPGCACKPGLVRDTMISNKCVDPNYCPFFDEDYPLCVTNEEYQECGSNCTSTCQHDISEIACTKQCISGFFCCKGYLKDEATRMCIKPDDCPCV